MPWHSNGFYQVHCRCYSTVLYVCYIAYNKTASQLSNCWILCITISYCMQVILVGLPTQGAIYAHEADTLRRDCYAFVTVRRNLYVPVYKD
jgi:hypothetical protein